MPLQTNTVDDKVSDNARTIFKYLCPASTVIEKPTDRRKLNRYGSRDGKVKHQHASEKTKNVLIASSSLVCADASPFSAREISFPDGVG